MLEGLDTINWEQLSHAYGPATDVPDLIRALLSPDPEEVDETLDDLYSTIWHQGTFYEATAYAIPFLLELLESDEMQDKASLLGLLEGIAKGYAYQDVHVPKRDKREIPIEIKKELGWAEAAHQAAQQGILVYLNLLHDDDHMIRAFAAFVLAKFPEDAMLITGELRTAIKQDADPEVKAELVANLGHLILSCDDFPEEQRRDYAGFFEAIFLDAPDEELELAAAVSLVQVTKTAAPNKAVDVLINGLANFDQRKSGIAYGKYNILPAIRELGATRSIAALLRALEVARSDDIVHEIAVTLLRITFSDEPMQQHATAYSRKDGIRKIEYLRPYGMPKEVPPLETIIGDQHQVIEALLNCDVFWQVDTNLLYVFGLPNDRDTLKSYLQNH